MGSPARSIHGCARPSNGSRIGSRLAPVSCCATRRVETWERAHSESVAFGQQSFWPVVGTRSKKRNTTSKRSYRTRTISNYSPRRSIPNRVTHSAISRRPSRTWASSAPPSRLNRAERRRARRHLVSSRDRERRLTWGCARELGKLARMGVREHRRAHDDHVREPGARAHSHEYPLHARGHVHAQS